MKDELLDFWDSIPIRLRAFKLRLRAFNRDVENPLVIIIISIPILGAMVVPLAFSGSPIWAIIWSIWTLTWIILLSWSESE